MNRRALASEPNGLAPAREIPSRRRDRRNKRDRRDRRGIATLWLLASGAVLGLLLIVLTDTARLYLARIELQNALDASVLSAVKTRCQSGASSASNLAARVDGRDAYLENFPSITVPTAIQMDTNEGGAGPNGNSRCPSFDCPDGLILLGSIYYPAVGSPTELVFDGDTAPDKVQIVVRADASNSFGEPQLFSVSLNGATPANIQSLTINLTPAGSQFDPGDGVADSAGYGPFPAAPLAPLASYSLDATSPSTAVMTVNFDGTFSAGTSFSFGIDTDPLGIPTGPQASSGLAGATVAVVLSDGSVLASGLVPAGLGVVEAVMLAGVNECAVQARGCVEVSSIAPLFLGEIFGPYSVRAKSTAWYRCVGSDAEPQLVRVQRSICNGAVSP